MTALSYQAAPRAGISGVFPLARVSLLVSVMLSSGCLVADPPLYEEPPPTPPMFDLSEAEPPPGTVRVIRRTGSNPETGLDISVPFRSDDRGERVFAALHVDYNVRFVPDSFTAVQSAFAASTLDDQDRAITLRWPFGPDDPSPGCHTLTLLVSHENTWNEREFRPDVVLAENDRAMAVWWLNFDPPEDDPYTLRDCPSPASTTESN